MVRPCELEDLLRRAAKAREIADAARLFAREEKSVEMEEQIEREEAEWRARDLVKD